MGTLSHLLDAVMQLPEDLFQVGRSKHDRAEELEVISVLIPEDWPYTLRRGCMIENGDRVVRVRVMNGRIHDLRLYADKNGHPLVTHNGARLRVSTTEEFREYVAGLCANITTEKAGA